MPIVLALLVVLVALALIALPQLWVTHVIERHSRDRPDFPGTGGEFARHILDEAGLGHVLVEPTERGDHYDPETKAVRLLSRHHNGRSLSAVVIAAHEVGHAIQHATNYGPMVARMRLAKTSFVLERVAAAMMFASPIVMAITKSVIVFGLTIGLAFLMFMLGIVFQLVTLPVELDASFGRALPLLEKQQYIPAKDIPAARHILKAAAYTYVAAALMSLLNIARWMKMLRI